MKKYCFLIFFLFSFAVGHTQLVHENTFSNSGNITEISEGVYKIYTMDDYNNVCNIYNADYSLWKSINLPIPEGEILVDIQFVSQYLFNLDSKVELMYVYRKTVAATPTTAAYYVYTTRIIDDSGSILIEIPNGYTAKAYNYGAKGSKFVIWTYDYSSFVASTIFYSVPGKVLDEIKDINNKFSELNYSYPNPAKNEINLKYSLPNNMEEAELVIVNATGKTIIKYRINNMSEFIKIDVSSFEYGIYYYYWESNSQKIGNNKFVIAK